METEPPLLEDSDFVTSMHEQFMGTARPSWTCVPEGATSGSLATMHTVPPALERGAAVRAGAETLGTAVPGELVALAGTGKLQCQPKVGTGRNWALQCQLESRHWRTKEHPTPPFRHFSIANCSQITLNIARTPLEGNHDLISPQ